jgi:hypothetical protein
MKKVTTLPEIPVINGGVIELSLKRAAKSKGFTRMLTFARRDII